MTTYKITYTTNAREDFKAIYSYIAIQLQARDTARRLVNGIREEIHSLREFPERYARVDWEPWMSMEMRRFSVGNFVIYYLVDNRSRAVTVIRIFYGGRDIEHIVSDQER